MMGQATAPCGTNPTGDRLAFEQLSRNLGLALTPTTNSMAATLGVNTFEFAFNHQITGLHDSDPRWERTIEGSPPAMLNLTSFLFRKGLPYSLEFDGHLSYLIQSELWAMGLGFKWGLNEAIDVVPVDLSVRGSVHHTVGSSQLNLTTSTFGLLLGRSFAVAQSLRLSPYVAYQPLWIFTSSSVLDATPGVYDLDQSQTTSFVFQPYETMINRYALGLRFLFGRLTFGMEGLFTTAQQSYSFNFGLQL